MGRSITCPTCGVHRMVPSVRRISAVPWADCACSDEVTCAYHKISDVRELPRRPTDADLAERAVLLHREDCKDFAEEAARFERARQLADLLRNNADFAAQVDALLAQGRKL